MAYEGNIRCVVGAVADSTLSSKQFHFAKPGVDGWTLAGTKESAWAVINDPATSAGADIAYSGVVKIMTGTGGCNHGHCACDSSGHVVTLTSGDFIAGYALTDTVAGEYASVLLSPSWCRVVMEDCAANCTACASVLPAAMLLANVVLAGSLAGASSVTAALSAELPIAAAVTDASTVTGRADCEAALLADVAGASSVTAPYLETDVPIEGAIAGASDVAPDLTCIVPLDAAVSDDSTVTGDLTCEAGMEATIAGTSEMTGDATCEAGMEAEVAGVCSITADLSE